MIGRGHSVYDREGSQCVWWGVVSVYDGERSHCVWWGVVMWQGVVSAYDRERSVCGSSFMLEFLEVGWVQKTSINCVRKTPSKVPITESVRKTPGKVPITDWQCQKDPGKVPITDWQWQKETPDKVPITDWQCQKDPWQSSHNWLTVSEGPLAKFPSLSDGGKQTPGKVLLLAGPLRARWLAMLCMLISCSCCNLLWHCCG